MRWYLSLLIILLVGQAPVILSYYGYLVRFKKDDCEVVCFADYHGDYYDGNADLKHKKCICNILANKSLDDWHMIVEDFAGYNGSHEGARSRQRVLKLLSACSPLRGLHDFFKNKDVSVFNAEYRFLRETGVAPILDPNGIGTLLLDPENPVMTMDVVQEFDETIKEVEKYSTPNSLVDYYHSQLDAIKPNRDYLNKRLATRQSLARFIEHELPEEKRRAFVYELFKWDVRAFDARVIHQIASTHKPKIGVFLGAAHIWNIGLILEKLGYKKVAVNGKEQAFDYPHVNFEALPHQEALSIEAQKKQKQPIVPLEDKVFESIFKNI